MFYFSKQSQSDFWHFAVHVIDNTGILSCGLAATKSQLLFV